MNCRSGNAFRERAGRAAQTKIVDGRGALASAGDQQNGEAGLKPESLARGGRVHPLKLGSDRHARHLDLLQI